MSLSARADKSTYTWDDPIALTVTLSLVGSAPCLVDRANGGGWHNLGCYPSFVMEDPSAGVVGPWVVACTTANFQPHVLTTQSPDVVVVNGAVNCQADIDNPCTPPNTGTRPWKVTVTWMWDARSAVPVPYGQANYAFNVEVTQPAQPTTTTAEIPSTTTPPAITTTTGPTFTTTRTTGS